MDHQELNIFKPCSKIIKHAVISMMIYIPVYAMHMSRTVYHYIKKKKEFRRLIQPLKRTWSVAEITKNIRNQNKKYNNITVMTHDPMLRSPLELDTTQGGVQRGDEMVWWLPIERRSDSRSAGARPAGCPCMTGSSSWTCPPLFSLSLPLPRQPDGMDTLNIPTNHPIIRCSDDPTG
jgi:hypothetical protein